MNEAQHVWSTQSLTVASAFSSLGFPVRVTDTERLHDGHRLVEFGFRNASVHRPGLRLIPLRNDLRQGKLAAQDPRHPLLVALHTLHNFDALLDFQKTGRPHRLVATAAGGFWIYEPGTEQASLNVPEAARFITNSPALAAALGLLGLPVIGIEGSHTARRYHLPSLGHDPQQPPAAQLAQLDPDVPQQRGQLPALLLERTDPHHPLVAAWNALNHRLMLKNALDKTTRRLVLEPRHGNQPLSTRAALISEAASDRVLARVEKHFLR